MEDCCTPTLTQVVEFKYERTPNMVFDATRLQEAQNLFVNCTNLRCFTPTTCKFQSPGLSPISEMTKTFINVVESGLQKLEPMELADRYKSPTTLPAAKQTAPQQFAKPMPKQKTTTRYQHTCDAHYIGDSPVVSLNSTTISDSECSIEVTSPNESLIQSHINSLLERTLSVTTLLRSVGLEQYGEVFAQHDLNLEQFISMSAEELQRYGVRSQEHRKIIMDLLSEFNAA